MPRWPKADGLHGADRTESDRDDTLLLGGGGFLGPWLVRALAPLVTPGDPSLSAGHPGSVARGLTVAGRSTAVPEPQPVPRPLPMDLPGVRVSPHLAVAMQEQGLRSASFVRLDLEREDPVQLLERVRPSRVLFNAALSRVADAERHRERAERLNCLVPARVASWCAENEARFVFVSTDLVFGERDAPQGGFEEDAAAGPLHEYGRSKAAGEKAVLHAHPTDAVIVRLPLLFGPSCGQALGASDALFAALERGDRPALFTDEMRTPLDVRDAACVLAECLWGPFPARGVLHAAGAERVDRFELGRRVLRAEGWGEQEIERALRPSTRAAAGLATQRARDVSLDASWARTSLRTSLRGIDEALADRLPD